MYRQKIKISHFNAIVYSIPRLSRHILNIVIVWKKTKCCQVHKCLCKASLYCNVSDSCWF